MSCSSHNPLHANQYVLNAKHELTYMPHKTYTSLNEHAYINKEADQPTHSLMANVKKLDKSIIMC